MATKYWQLKLKGERGIEEIQATVGRGGGLLVRLDVEAGETRVYYAAEESTTAELTKALKGVGVPTEVRAADLAKLA
jgi:hypothetical protein